MNAHTSISIDRETKRKAELRAKKDSMRLSTVVRLFLNDYSSGKVDIGMRYAITSSHMEPEIEVLSVSPRLQKKMDTAMDALHAKVKKRTSRSSR